MSGRSHFLDEEQALVSYFSQMLSEPDDKAQGPEVEAPAKSQAAPEEQTSGAQQPKATEAAAPAEEAPQPQMQLAPEPEHEERPLEERPQPSLESLLEKVGDATEAKTAVETATENKTAVETATETAAETRTAVETATEAATGTAVKTATQTETEAATETATMTATQAAGQTAVETKTETATAVKSAAEEAADLAMIEAAQAQAVATETEQATETAQAAPAPAETAADQAMIAAAREEETPPDPLAWKNIDLPDEFQALFFLVKGVRFAVPLVELGGIFETPKLTSLFGKPAWYKGMADIRGRKMNVVDTLRWVKPDVDFESDYAYLIMLGKSLWSIGCDTLEGNRVIRRDSVNWRTQAGTRPWLAGIVKKEMCALIHVKAMIAMFERGMGMMPGQGAAGADAAKAG